MSRATMMWRSYRGNIRNDIDTTAFASGLRVSFCQWVAMHAICGLAWRIAWPPTETLGNQSKHRRKPLETNTNDRGHIRHCCSTLPDRYRCYLEPASTSGEVILIILCFLAPCPLASETGNTKTQAIAPKMILDAKVMFELIFFLRESLS
jgi:hypothetical protein